MMKSTRQLLLSVGVSIETQDALSPSESKQGFILVCQAHATSDIVIDA